MGCVYLATNTVNGKMYVGKGTYGLENRRASHEDIASKGKGNVFHCALRKYGFNVFKWERLYRSSDNEKLLEREIFYIKLLSTRCPGGYNLTDGGGGILGFRHSDVARDKIGAASRGKKKPPLPIEVCARISATLSGRKLSAEHCANIGASMKGKKQKRGPQSPEHTAKIAAANTGKKRSPEACANISAGLKGKKRGPQSPEITAKIAASNRGKKRSLEACANISAGSKGKKRSLEVCIQMSIDRTGKRHPHVGRPQSADHRAKLSVSCSGWKQTPEACAKIGAGVRAAAERHRAKALVEGGLKLLMPRQRL